MSATDLAVVFDAPGSTGGVGRRISRLVYVPKTRGRRDGEGRTRLGTRRWGWLVPG
ncbi:MAG: hypothetical protein M5R40_07310 [Anaerolineae bacterium]|nr:hypothetical protein [Anaerolineae bacterium]